MQDIKEKIKKVFESKSSVKVLYIVGGVVVVMLVFHAGVVVGFHKASFGRNWGDNYERNFGMGARGDARKGGMMGGFNKVGMMGYFPNAHGATGKIIKIESPTIIVLDKDNTEKVIIMNKNTEIERIRDDISFADLELDDFVTVIGAPNKDGQIEAKLIRVLPAPDLLNNLNTNVQ